MPAPGVALSEVGPAIAVFRIDDTNTDEIVGGWKAMLNGALHAKGEATGGVELQFVVVAEPMKCRTFGDGSDWRQSLRARKRCRQEAS